MTNNTTIAGKIKLIPALLFSITVEKRNKSPYVTLSVIIDDELCTVSGFTTHEELIEYVHRIGDIINVGEVTEYRLTPNPVFIPATTAQTNSNSKQTE